MLMVCLFPVIWILWTNKCIMNLFLKEMGENVVIVILRVIRYTVETKQSIFQGIRESISKDVKFIARG